MSTTIPTKFVGTPILTDRKVSIIKDWYIQSLGDSDKAGDIEDSYYYQALSDGYSDVLKLLYGMGIATAAAVADDTKKSRSFKKPLIVVGIGVGIYALWNYEKIRAKITEQNEKLRAQAREDAKIKKIQDNHTPED